MLKPLEKLRVTIKEPGPGGMRLVEVPLDMSFADALGPGGRVVSVDIWADTVLLKDDEGERRTLTLEELKAEVSKPPAGEPN